MKKRFLVEVANTTVTYIEVDSESVGDIHNIFHEGGIHEVMNAGHIIGSRVGEDAITKVSLTNGQPDRSQCAD